MANFEYDSMATSIRLRFQCPECEEYIETESIYPSNPEFTAESLMIVFNPVCMNRFAKNVVLLLKFKWVQDFMEAQKL